VPEPLHQHRVVGADDAVAARFVVCLAQHRAPEALRRLHRPQKRPVQRGLHDLVTHALDRLRDGSAQIDAP
jgi:hypothetical protein